MIKFIHNYGKLPENGLCISCLSCDTLKIEQQHMASFIAKDQRYTNK